MQEQEETVLHEFSSSLSVRKSSYILPNVLIYHKKARNIVEMMKRYMLLNITRVYKV
jgi:hypothetical protein